MIVLVLKMAMEVSASGIAERCLFLLLWVNLFEVSDCTLKMILWILYD